MGCVWDAWVQDGVPDHIHVQCGSLELDDFHSSLLPEFLSSSLDCGAFPVIMVGLLIEHGLHCHSWGLLISLLVCVHSA